MTDAAGDVAVHEHTSSVLGLPLVRYSCSCGYLTGLHLALECNVVQDAASTEMREHLVDEHPGGDWPYGRCGECGTVTDEFRARVPGLGLDSWLCRQHAPSRPQVVDQAADPA
jgi:hypothetical protein